MGKKRGEKRPAPSPPPLPVASSEGTRSGADESGDEETIAVSRTPAPKNPPPPPQKGEESETFDEEEEPPPAAPTAAPRSTLRWRDRARTPTIPTTTRMGVPDLTKMCRRRSHLRSRRRRARRPRSRAWPSPLTKRSTAAHQGSTNNEVRIIEALAAHQKEHRVLPQPDALVEALGGKLDNRAYSSKELQGKVKSLKHRYVSAAKKYELPTKEHDRRLFDLSKTVWSRDKSMARAAIAPTAAATAPTAAAIAKANNHDPKGFEEMCELYPYLAEEVRKLEAPGMFKREFGKMDDDKARLLDEKIKKQRVAQMKVELRRSDLAREVTKAVMDLID